MRKRHKKVETIVWKGDNELANFDPAKFSIVMDLLVRETKSKKIEMEMTNDGLRIIADDFEVTI